MEQQYAKISKFMSLVLRHKPQEIGLTLNEEGWANVEELISKLNTHGATLDINILQFIVDNNDKKRFAFNEDKTMIRASQGHSIEVDLNLPVSIPPDILYHGTADDTLSAVLKQGLKKQKRQHVHLSVEPATAISVGTRHGKPVLLEIDTIAMQQEGYVFYLSANGVWLTDEVPAQFIKPKR
jgi:putative RNA 2'-phosphotransferase